MAVVIKSVISAGFVMNRQFAACAFANSPAAQSSDAQREERPGDLRRATYLSTTSETLRLIFEKFSFSVPSFSFLSACV